MTDGAALNAYRLGQAGLGEAGVAACESDPLLCIHRNVTLHVTNSLPQRAVYRFSPRYQYRRKDVRFRSHPVLKHRLKTVMNTIS
jgi:hypothetical protein